MVSRLLNHCCLVSTLAHLRAISVIDQSNIRSSTRYSTVDIAVSRPSLHRIPLFGHLLFRCRSSSESQQRLSFVIQGDGVFSGVFHWTEEWKEEAVDHRVFHCHDDFNDRFDPFGLVRMSSEGKHPAGIDKINASILVSRRSIFDTFFDRFTWR